MSGPTIEHRHLTPHLIALALEDGVGPENLEEILETCSICREASRTLDEWCRLVGHPRLHVGCEYATAPDLLREVLAMPQSQRILAIEEESEFQRWGLCTLLIHESFEGRFHVPEIYLDLAHLALRLSRILDQSFYGASQCADLQARALANVGNARRKMRQFHAAGDALEEAENCWSKGTQNPRILGEILCLRGSLEHQLDRSDTARALLESALYQFRRAQDAAGEVRGHVAIAAVLIDISNFDAAIQILERELPQLKQPTADPRLRTVAVYNLATAYLEVGDLERMERLIPLIPATDPLCALKRDWLIANVLAIRGQDEHAVATYREVRKGYLEFGLGFDAALVTLELVLLCLVLGQDDEAYRLAEEILEVLKDDAIYSRAAEALILFTRQARDRSLSEQAVREFRRYIRRAYGKPHLAWSPSPEPPPG